MEGKEETIEVHLPLKPPKFNWRVNDEKAYFELGNPKHGDDRYTVNITIVSASYLHLLGTDQGKNRENYNWSIQYKAFDCDISSDSFQLANDEISRRTYIGDKATARIRANGLIFCEFLRHTSIEFDVVQISAIDGTEKQVGVGCLDLKNLTKPNVNELKYILHVISTDGSVPEFSDSTKPEIRVLVQLDTEPNFFSFEEDAGESAVLERSEISPEKEGNKRGDKFESPTKETAVNLSTSGKSDAQNKSQNESAEIDVTDGGGEPRRVKTKSKVAFQGDAPDSAITSPLNESNEQQQHDNTGDSEEDNVVKHEDENLRQVLSISMEKLRSNTNLKASHSKVRGDEHESPSRPSIQAEVIKSARDQESQVEKSHSHESFLSRLIREHEENKNQRQAQIQGSPSYQVGSIGSSSSTSESEGGYEAEIHSRPSVGLTGEPVDVVKAGEYRVVIQFNKLFVQSKSPLEDSFTLSYIFPPLGLNTPVTATARPDPSYCSKNENLRRAVILDGTWTMVVRLTHLSDELIHEPIYLEIDNKKYACRRTPSFYANVPFGNVFFQKLRGHKRVFSGRVDVRKTKGDKKVGLLDFMIHLAYPQPNIYNTLEESMKPTKANCGGGEAADESLVRKTRVSLENWKLLQEEKFKQCLEQKEKAYIQILSDEWNKRDREREMYLDSKVRKVESKEKELERQLKIVTEKEGTLRTLESEVKQAALKNSSEQAQIIEASKYKIRQMEIEHKHELESLRRRVAESNAEFEKVKGKALILENKLKNREDEFAELMRSRNKWPDIELTIRLETLQRQNDLLREQLADAQKERDKYKREANTLCHQLKLKQREQDARLHQENENLRVQLFAKDQKADLLEERQSVKDISDKIKKLLDEKGGLGSGHPKPTGPPVTRHVRILTPSPARRAKEYARGHPVDLKSKAIAKPQPKAIAQATKANQTNGNDSFIDREYLEKEINRLVGERTLLLESGSYTQYDLMVRNIEAQITKLASQICHYDYP